MDQRSTRPPAIAHRAHRNGRATSKSKIGGSLLVSTNPRANCILSFHRTVGPATGHLWTFPSCALSFEFETLTLHPTFACPQFVGNLSIRCPFRICLFFIHEDTRDKLLVKPDANSDKRRSEQDKGGEFRHGTHLILTEQSKQVVLVFMLTCCIPASWLRHTSVDTYRVISEFTFCSCTHAGNVNKRQSYCIRHSSSGDT
ncbi:hypothetical protein BGW80DRAFT_332065 [Lactifluus volemus]|nr:hypothetical protein BGW80DRAFT_332065 [Lactifluus volemus]